jgi:ABC-type polysaccharide/polyol phosphate transport system ATPase subunit
VHEALDHEFRDHVEAYAHELVGAGGIVVATGHDHPMLERLCRRALLLQGGRVIADGEFHDVQRAYLGPRAG